MQSTNDGQPKPLPPGANASIIAVRAGFQESLRRCMGVADQREDGHPKRMPQTAFAKAAGVARSTVAKYLSPDDPINPDLETLCRLAHSLNVPPAYLLMTREDWQRLAYAAAALVAAGRTSELAELVALRPGVSGTLSPAQQALAGFDIAKRLGVTPTDFDLPTESATDKALSSERTLMNDRTRLSLLATCALPPLSSMAPQFEGVLLYLCAIIGANHK